MRRRRASSGLRHSCAEGESCCVRRVIPTKSAIRVELEQQMYADSNIVTNLPLIVQKGFRAFRHCLKGHLLYLIASCCGIFLSRSFWMVLETVRNMPKRLRSETKLNGRIARSNRRAGRVERSNASRGNIHPQCRE